MPQKEKLYTPKIKFVIDPDHDVNIAMWRYNAGYSSWSDFEEDVKKAKNKTAAKKIIKQKITGFYKDNLPEIKKKLKTVSQDWKKIEQKFYTDTAELFSGFPWPKSPEKNNGYYIGYASILRGFPRNINEKSFAVSANPFHKYLANIIIAHEILHFLEYEYLQKKFCLKPSECSSKDNTFWQFTENLNVLIEQSEMWSDIMQDRKAKPYKNCEKLFKRMKPIWDKTHSIDDLVKKIFKNKIK